MSSPPSPLVYLLDDNLPFRRSTTMLLETMGIEVRDFASGPELLAAFREMGVPLHGTCTVSDVRMPEMSGLELLEEMKRQNYATPIIFITAHADVALAVEAMRRGAANFIEKPFSGDVLVQAIRLAASQEHPPSLPATPTPMNLPNPKLATLTRRERQVLELVVAGKFNKTIADVLGISTKTVELHRASLMSKLAVRTVPDLVKIFLGYQ
jgi:FixJ family two-component response regulator